MQTLTIAIAIILQGNRYHLQYRNLHKSRGAANMIGCFGGKIEVNETPSKAILRELAEETNLSLKQADVHYKGVVKVVSDNQLKPVEIKAHVFSCTLAESINVQAKDGILVTYDKNEIKENFDTMTPATKASFKEFVGV